MKRADTKYISNDDMINFTVSGEEDWGCVMTILYLQGSNGEV